MDPNFLYDLYRCRNTCIEMLRDRNYKTHCCMTMNFDEFCVIMNSEELNVENILYLSPIDLETSKIDKFEDTDKKIKYSMEDDEEDDVLEDFESTEVFPYEKPPEESEYFEKLNKYNPDSTSTGTSSGTSTGTSSGTSDKPTEVKDKKYFEDSPKLPESAGGTTLSNIDFSISTVGSIDSNQIGGGGSDVIIDEVSIIKSPIVVKFLFKKAVTATIELLEKLLKNYKSYNIIIILCDDEFYYHDKLTNKRQIKEKYIKELSKTTSGTENVQLFYYKQLVVNITKHRLVPAHIYITDKNEIENVLKYYSLKHVKQLPVILTTDPISKYFGACPGNLFKIIRKTHQEGWNIVYRVIMEPELYLDE